MALYGFTFSNLIIAFKLDLKGITLKLKLIYMINISRREENTLLQMFSDQICCKTKNGLSFELCHHNIHMKYRSNGKDDYH